MRVAEPYSANGYVCLWSRMRSPERVSTFVEVSSELLARGYGVRFRASGGSMRPAICDGDLITVAPAAEGRVLPGNVIVYRDRGRLFAHRIVSVKVDEHGRRSGVLLRGDAALACDAPVSADQVLGEVVAVQRGHGAIGVGDFPDIAARVLRGMRRKLCGE